MRKKLLDMGEKGGVFFFLGNLSQFLTLVERGRWRG